MSTLRLPVEEFTTPDPITAGPDTSILELGQIMKEHGIRHIPVIEKDRIIGIVSDRDLKVAACLNSSEKSMVLAKDIMVRDPLTVSSESPLDEVAYLMSKNKIGSVIVNDENSQFLGIFTATDALNALIEVVRSSEEA